MKLEELKKEVWQANMELKRVGLSLSTWGNVSGIDRERELVVAKPDNIPYHELRVEHMLVVDLQGKIVEGRWNPLPDTLTHLVLYRHFSQIGGVAHTHSSFACVWAQAGSGIPCLGTTHADYFYGEIPCTRALTAGEIEENYESAIGEVIVERFRTLDYRRLPGVLVSYHGPFTWGKTPEEAVHHGIVLEEIAKTTYFALLLNPERNPVSLPLLDRRFFRQHGFAMDYARKTTTLRYKTVRLAANRVEAELIKGYLEAEGIGVILKPSTFPYGGEAYFGDTGPFEIQVPEERFADAQRIITDLER